MLATLLHGSFDLGVSAIAGSAIFNITVIAALAALVARDTLETSRDLVYKEAQFYMLSVSVLLFAFMRTRLVISRAEAAVLLAVYAGFVTWVVLESLGVTAALA